MPSLKNVQSKTATTILYLKCKSMERISGFLSYRKNQTRVALNKVFIMLNELRTKPLPFYDRVLYDKIITELKKYIPIDDNGNILTEVSFSNDFSVSTICKIEEYAMQGEELSKLSDLIAEAKAYTVHYKNAKNNLKNIVKELINSGKYTAFSTYLENIYMIAECSMTIYDDNQNVILDKAIQELKKKIH